MTKLELQPYIHTTHEIHTMDGKKHLIQSTDVAKFKAMAEKSKLIQIGEVVIAVHQITSIEPTPETHSARTARIEAHRIASKPTLSEKIMSYPPHERTLFINTLLERKSITEAQYQELLSIQYKF